MTEQECLAKMVAPGTNRPGKYGSAQGFGGVMQIHLTRACDLSCFNCTQGSNYGGKTHFMTPEQFGQAVESLRGYPGIIGVFGGNPAMSPHFVECCRILRESWVPFERRGLWCNNPLTIEKGAAMRLTFNPGVSNLNVHMSQKAYDMFKLYWPECSPCGLTTDSRHAPVYVAMRDVIEDDSRIWELISGCDINQHWSAMIGVFRGQLRAWFCEVAGAQSILHQDEPDYPDTGIMLNSNWPCLNNCAEYGPNGPVWCTVCCHDARCCTCEPDPWWKKSMQSFASQVRKHCFDCGVPLKGFGELAVAEKGCEQTSAVHAGVAHPKRRDRPVQVVDQLAQLGVGRLERMTSYLQNARK